MPNNDLICRSALLEELRKGVIITDDIYGMGIMEGLSFATRSVAAAQAGVPIQRGSWPEYNEPGDGFAEYDDDDVPF